MKVIVRDVCECCRHRKATKVVQFEDDGDVFAVCDDCGEFL